MHLGVSFFTYFSRFSPQLIWQSVQSFWTNNYLFILTKITLAVAMAFASNKLSIGQNFNFQCNKNIQPYRYQVWITSSTTTNNPDFWKSSTFAIFTQSDPLSPLARILSNGLAINWKSGPCLAKIRGWISDFFRRGHKNVFSIEK